MSKRNKTRQESSHFDLLHIDPQSISQVIFAAEKYATNKLPHLTVPLLVHKTKLKTTVNGYEWMISVVKTTVGGGLFSTLQSMRGYVLGCELVVSRRMQQALLGLRG